ncbi:hypothetical protein AgCh_001332 [Apium graveolens]
MSVRKIYGYKSHDAHFILQYLLQFVVIKTLDPEVAIPLIRLGSFFRGICGKVIDLEDVPKLQEEIIEILCQYEIIFPPAFFDIMVHLPIHLCKEIELGGPVHLRWMFGIERDLCKLKSYVRNRSKPEGCIDDGYLLEECLSFCSRFLSNERETKHTEGKENLGYPIGSRRNKDEKAIHLGEKLWNDAHRYIFFNYGDMEVEKLIEMANYFFLKFHHKGQFMKTKYLGGICIKIPTAMKADKFSFSVIMEHVMEDCKYTEIGGLYVKKAGGGWKIISNDAEANELVKGLADGLQQEHDEKKKLANDSQQLVIEKSGPREEVAVVQKNAEKKKSADCMLVVEEKMQKVKAVTKPSTRLMRSQTLNNVATTHETKCIIPEEGKGWVLRTMTELWRIHESRVKAEYYTKYSTDVERLQNRLASIPLERFKKKVTDVHNAGRTSFAQNGKNMKNKKKMPQTPRKGHIYPKTRKNPTELEGDVAETGGDSEAEEVQLDFDGHGPNWLVGRIDITRKTKKDAMKIEWTNLTKLEKLRDELAFEIEEKMNKKLEKIL